MKPSEPPMDPDVRKLAVQAERLLRWFTPIRLLIAALGIIITAVSLVLAGIQYLDSAAKKAVIDETFLAKLSARIRPSMIFDNKGVIEADFGASEYIDSVEFKPEKEAFGFRVLVHAKRHLVYPPMITGLDAGLYSNVEERAKGNDWRILVAPNSTLPTLLTEGMPDYATNTYRFRLEILH